MADSSGLSGAGGRDDPGRHDEGKVARKKVTNTKALAKVYYKEVVEAGKVAKKV